MTAASAHYDGHAEWYDDAFPPFSEDAECLEQLLGPGEGRLCLDVGCGTGRYAAHMARIGYETCGIDCSADQLRIANTRSGRLAQADARVLPIRTTSIDAAVGMYIHTDIEDFAEAVAEVARCLTEGGRFIYVGLHPCFIGPFVDRTNEHEYEALPFVRGYGDSGWAHRGSGGGIGLWARVGGHHKTLAEFIGAFTDAGLHLERVAELAGSGTIVPRNIAVVAAKR